MTVSNEFSLIRNAEIKEKNRSILVLKSVMCFLVITCHFYTTKTETLFAKSIATIQMCAVPVFMMLSFFFEGKHLAEQNREHLKKRIKRLIVPHIGWTLVYFVVFFLIYRFVLQEDKINLKDLLWQLSTGHSGVLNPAMWFQINLLFLTVSFSAVFHFFDFHKRSVWPALAALVSFCLLIQYSNINSILLVSLPYELKYPLGRIFETIPMAIIGIFLALYEPKHRMSNIPRRCIAITLLILSFVMVGLIIILNDGILHAVLMPQGFGYSGIGILIISTLVVVFTLLLPYKSRTDRVNYYIDICTKYTMGIYCIHNLVGKVLLQFLEICNISLDPFVCCIIIYISSYIICFILHFTQSSMVKQMIE